MHTRGSTIKYTAVAALTVLALTGFSTGRHGSRHHGHGDSTGGGCSNSRQDHDSSTSTGRSATADDDYDYGYGDSYGTGGAGAPTDPTNRRPGYRSTPTASSATGGSGQADGTAKLVSCATTRDPYATVAVTNPNGRKGTFAVRVDFENSADLAFATRSATITVAAKDTATVRVKAPDDLVAAVDHCVVERRAEIR
ncbi:hypothetical protein ABZ682_16455 [Streptomyces griseoviridis]|uniref:hypothetical protein n=1 Tax=Streptomyces griseoviridis TaxID=45398 RepID=UPI0033DA596B